MTKVATLLAIFSILCGLMFSSIDAVRRKELEVERIRQRVEQKCILEYATRDIPANTLIQAADVEKKEADIFKLSSPFPLGTAIGSKYSKDVKKGQLLTGYLKYPNPEFWEPPNMRQADRKTSDNFL